MRYAARLLAILLALVLTLLLPRRAVAAIVQVCEDEAMSVLPMATEPSGPFCDVVTSVDEETGETTAAPICDPRGASAIAPPRIHPISDARIDAAPGCSDSHLLISVRPGSSDPSSEGTPSGPALHAILASVLPGLPAPPAPMLLRPMPVPGGPRAGVPHDIYHPPR